MISDTHLQVAQQEAERARFLVEQAEQEKQANIIRAEGDNEVSISFFFFA
jgi:prohibitin 1